MGEARGRVELKCESMRRGEALKVVEGLSPTEMIYWFSSRTNSRSRGASSNSFPRALRASTSISPSERVQLASSVDVEIPVNLLLGFAFGFFAFLSFFRLLIVAFSRIRH